MQCTYLAAGPWSWDWCSVSLGGPFKNKQANLTFALLIFFLEFYSFYLFIFYSEYKTKTLQKVNKLLKKKHYKTKSFHIKFWCMLFRLQPQNLPINIETFTMPSTRAKRKQNCICILTNIKMSFLDMTCYLPYEVQEGEVVLGPPDGALLVVGQVEALLGDGVQEGSHDMVLVL